MGIFGTIFKGIVGAIRGGISGLSGATTRVAPAISRFGPAARSIGGGVAGGLAVDAAGRLITSVPHPGPITGSAARAQASAGTGGNGLTFRQTLVQTIEVGTSRVVSEQVLRGSPFLMRNDIQIAKRVIRTASKLGRLKGIRHTVRQSSAAKLKDAIEQKALDQVLAGGKC